MAFEENELDVDHPPTILSRESFSSTILNDLKKNNKDGFPQYHFKLGVQEFSKINLVMQLHRLDNERKGDSSCSLFFSSRMCNSEMPIEWIDECNSMILVVSDAATCNPPESIERVYPMPTRSFDRPENHNNNSASLDLVECRKERPFATCSDLGANPLPSSAARYVLSVLERIYSSGQLPVPMLVKVTSTTDSSFKWLGVDVKGRSSFSLLRAELGQRYPSFGSFIREELLERESHGTASISGRFLQQYDLVPRILVDASDDDIDITLAKSEDDNTFATSYIVLNTEWDVDCLRDSNLIWSRIEDSEAAKRTQNTLIISCVNGLRDHENHQKYHKLALELDNLLALASSPLPEQAAPSSSESEEKIPLVSRSIDLLLSRYFSSGIIDESLTKQLNPPQLKSNNNNSDGKQQLLRLSFSDIWWLICKDCADQIDLHDCFLALIESLEGIMSKKSYQFPPYFSAIPSPGDRFKHISQIQRVLNQIAASSSTSASITQALEEWLKDPQAYLVDAGISKLFRESLYHILFTCGLKGGLEEEILELAIDQFSNGSSSSVNGRLNLLVTLQRILEASDFIMSGCGPLLPNPIISNVMSQIWQKSGKANNNNNAASLRREATRTLFLEIMLNTQNVKEMNYIQSVWRSESNSLNGNCDTEQHLGSCFISGRLTLTSLPSKQVKKEILFNSSCCFIGDSLESTTTTDNNAGVAVTEEERLLNFIERRVLA